MNFYQLDTAACEDPDFVFLQDEVKGTEADSYQMEEGESMGGNFPANARLEMGPDSAGFTLPSLIGNIFQLLIVQRDLKELLESTGVPLECYGFTLIDHRKHVASRDHFIVNPLGAFECIDDQASAIRYAKAAPTVIIAIDRLVLDSKKLEQAPDFFRIGRQPRRYVVSERLGQRIAALDPTNVVIQKIEQNAP